MFVKIIRQSIRKNPDAGKSSFTVPGVKSASFRATQKIPNEYAHLVVVTSETITGEMYECTGLILNPEHCESIAQLDGFSVSISQKSQTIHHLPEPKYLYVFENPILFCEGCAAKISLSEIDNEYDDEGRRYTVCPKCGEYNSFEDVEYERIGDVAKELGLN